MNTGGRETAARESSTDKRLRMRGLPVAECSVDPEEHDFQDPGPPSTLETSVVPEFYSPRGIYGSLVEAAGTRRETALLQQPILSNVLWNHVPLS